MRVTRIMLLLLAFYLTFVGGGTYYQLFLPIRIAHHILITVLLSLWLVNRIRRRDKNQPPKGLPQTALNIPIYAAVAIWFITALTSIDPRMAFEHIWFPLIHTLFFFVIVDLLQRGFHRLVMEIVFLIAALVVFITGLELASWYFGLGILPNTTTGWVNIPLAPSGIPRVSLAMSISTLLAGYTAPLVTVTAAWALTARRKDYRIVLWVLAALLLGVLLLTYSRGGLISLFGGVGTFVLFRLAQHSQITVMISPRKIIGTGLILGALVVGVFIFLTLPFGRGHSDEGRVDMWRSAIEITRDNPIVGVGPGLFGREFRDYRDPSLARDKLASAHNAYLNTASETGLLGIVVSLGLGVAFLRAAWRTWQIATTYKESLRIEGTVAALVGVALHSLVDVFTITPIVLLIVTLIAYAITGRRSRIDPVPQGKSLPALIALIIILGYGIWLLQLDRAHNTYQNGFQLPTLEEKIAATNEAASIDPYLRLYPLHKALLLGEQVNIELAIDVYQQALELEPTWDIGWINLAALEEKLGNPEQAMAHLQRAWDINHLNTASLHWARLAEANQEIVSMPDEEIVLAYLSGLRTTKQLPLSGFWWETPLRREAIHRYLEKASIESQYRVLSAHEPEGISQLVPENPQTAAEWWALGEHTLTIGNRPDLAVEHFIQAIERSPYNGDYYVSRARALRTLDPEAAAQDLDIAQLLGTRSEFPNALRAQLTNDDQETITFKETALPSRAVPQEFAAVLYARPAVFDVLQSMHYPGYGRAELSPLYQLAYDYIEQENPDRATQIFRHILELAPFEEEAAQQLELLRAGL